MWERYIGGRFPPQRGLDNLAAAFCVIVKELFPHFVPGKSAVSLLIALQTKVTKCQSFSELFPVLFHPVLLQRVNFHSQLQPRQIRSEGKQELLCRAEGKQTVIYPSCYPSSHPSTHLASLSPCPSSSLQTCSRSRRTAESTQWGSTALCLSPALVRSMSATSAMASLWP